MTPTALYCAQLGGGRASRQHREEGLATLRQNWRGLPAGPDHTKRACEVGCLEALRPLSEPGSRGPAGHRRCGRAPCCRMMDGKYVLLTNDDTLSPEDVGLGYKAMIY